MTLTLSEYRAAGAPAHHHRINGKPVAARLFSYVETRATAFDSFCTAEKSPGVFCHAKQARVPDDFANLRNKLTAAGVAL